MVLSPRGYFADESRRRRGWDVDRVRGDASRRRRGCDVDSPRRRDAAAVMWKFRSRPANVSGTLRSGTRTGRILIMRDIVKTDPSTSCRATGTASLPCRSSAPASKTRLATPRHANPRRCSAKGLSRSSCRSDEDIGQVWDGPTAGHPPGTKRHVSTRGCFADESRRRRGHDVGIPWRPAHVSGTGARRIGTRAPATAAPPG